MLTLNILRMALTVREEAGEPQPSAAAGHQVGPVPQSKLYPAILPASYDRAVDSEPGTAKITARAADQ